MYFLYPLPWQQVEYAQIVLMLFRYLILSDLMLQDCELSLEHLSSIVVVPRVLRFLWIMMIELLLFVLGDDPDFPV